MNSRYQLSWLAILSYWVNTILLSFNKQHFLKQKWLAYLVLMSKKPYLSVFIFDVCWHSLWLCIKLEGAQWVEISDIIPSLNTLFAYYRRYKIRLQMPRRMLTLFPRTFGSFVFAAQRSPVLSSNEGGMEKMSWLDNQEWKTSYLHIVPKWK